MKKEFWFLWQLLMPGSGRRVWELIHHFGSPQLAWEASEEELSEVQFLGRQGAQRLIKRKSTLQYDRLCNYLEKIQCKVITIEDSDYPIQLKSIYDPPPAVFLRGSLPTGDITSMAMVGSRKPTAYGLAVAETFAYELAGVGINIISGMARGIDSASHQGSLKAGGTTIAVLGCGPDVVYPRENKKLMHQIIEKGAILTEFPPGTAPESWHFPSRNRIISGLSDAILVVEAAEKSGALITADFALEQGREVFAIPGNINSPKSAGTNKLIRQGARFVTQPADILEELGLGEIALQPKDRNLALLQGLTPNEGKAYEALSHDPLALDQLVNAAGLSAEEVTAAVTLLEIKGLVKTLPGKMYVLAGL